MPFKLYSHRKESTRHTLCNSPKVFPSFDNTAVGGSHIFSGTNDGKRHGVEKYSSIFSSGLIIGIDGGLVNTDALSGNHLANLGRNRNQGSESPRRRESLTRCLNA